MLIFTECPPLLCALHFHSLWARWDHATLRRKDPSWELWALPARCTDGNDFLPPWRMFQLYVSIWSFIYLPSTHLWKDPLACAASSTAISSRMIWWSLTVKARLFFGRGENKCGCARQKGKKKGLNMPKFQILCSLNRYQPLTPERPSCNYRNMAFKRKCRQ